MLSSYAVACPNEDCSWTGNLVPSHLRGGADAEIVSMHRAWFRCPRCQADWEVRITDDRVTVLPAVKHGVDSVSAQPGRAIAFDVDPASLASLRRALPGWEIDTIKGATPASLANKWDQGTADLLIVSACGKETEMLGLCRFLSFSTEYSTDARVQGTQTLSPREQHPALRLLAPLLVLLPPGQESLAGPALEAGARSCLLLPIHPNRVTTMLAHAWAGNQPGRHTLNLDRPQVEDRWRDDGGEG